VILCIAGSRSLSGERGVIHVRKAVAEALEEWGLTVADITEGVSGMARGADKIGYERFKAHGIPIKEFPADWENVTAPGAKIRVNENGREFNSKAGLWRNEEMAKYLAAGGGRCVIVYNREVTFGSKHMKNACARLRVPHYQYIAGE
jgi:hypothetical protein